MLAASARLTARDRRLVRAVGEHRVLTTGQVAVLGFDSVITARHRLSVLVEVGALRRFRPHREAGSAPWHYLLGPVGAALLGAEDRDERRWLTAIRADRQLALEHSQRLAHILGVNRFFAALVAHARTACGEVELRTWLNETAAADWLLARSYVSYGSEHLPQITAKVPGYARLAQAMANTDQVCPLLLFRFDSTRREQTARRALASCYDASAFRIATTAINPESTSPAGSVWLPLRRGTDIGGQVALSALDAAVPDLWQQHRAQRARAREQAAQADRLAEWARDGHDIEEAAFDSMMTPQDDSGEGVA